MQVPRLILSFAKRVVKSFGKKKVEKVLTKTELETDRDKFLESMIEVKKLLSEKSSYEQIRKLIDAHVENLMLRKLSTPLHMANVEQIEQLKRNDHEIEVYMRIRRLPNEFIDTGETLLVDKQDAVSKVDDDVQTEDIDREHLCWK